MLLRDHFDILLVDDDPDVLTVSKLVLKRVTFFGAPLKVHTAASKAEAIELLKKTKADFAVGFIDVVMESEHAGLELCQWIREELGNSTIQLIIRTGQAGRAPEKEVVDRYDISGYLLKTDATEDKLYCILKTALKQWCFTDFTLNSLDFVSSIITAGSSPAELVEHLTSAKQGDKAGSEPEQAWFVGDKVKGTGRFQDAAVANAAREKLSKLPLVTLNKAGDGYVRDGDELLLRLKSEPKDMPVELLVGVKSLKVPDFVLKPTLLVHLIRMKSVRNLIALSGGVVEDTVKAASPFGFLGGWF